MPIYDYKCAKCSHKFEQRESIENHKKPTKEPCPECKEENCVEQCITCPAIVDSIRIGVTKPPSDFQKYVLGRIKASVPGNRIGEKTPLVREV